MERISEQLPKLYALFAVVLLMSLMLGCGSDEPEQAEGQVRAVHWYPGGLHAGGRELSLTAAVPSCEGESKPKIVRSTLAETRRKVVITVFAEFPVRKRSDQGGCLGVLLPVHASVSLRSPLRGRALIDGRGGVRRQLKS
jgi:hypothetical protein